jgi:hypothetical protein
MGGEIHFTSQNDLQQDSNTKAGETGLSVNSSSLMSTDDVKCDIPMNRAKKELLHGIYCLKVIRRNICKVFCATTFIPKQLWHFQHIVLW